MPASFFFYDLETTGIDARSGRIMQFAGQRADLDLQPVGDPFNIFIKLTPDVVPEPDAILVTGITPQSTLEEGLTEAEFLRVFHEQVVKPDTTFLGYNTVRFDDEFMRFLHWRNFYDAYEWSWCDGCSRWDLLDVVRLTRALRPDGINWPMTDDGKPTNRLELLTKLNGLDHENAHDALNDVNATIAVAKLIKTKQPKLFDYQFNLRTKKAVASFLDEHKTFIYSSGKFSNETEKTAVVGMVDGQPPNKDTAIVWNLRFDPTPFLNLSAEQLADRYAYTRDEKAPPRLPIKMMKFNRCPALSPAGAIKEPAVQQRLQVTPEQIETHWRLLQANKPFQKRIMEAVALLEERQRTAWPKRDDDADGQLYDGGFISQADKTLSRAIRAAQPEEFDEYVGKLKDERLQELLPLYKARNYPDSLSPEERQVWEGFVYKRLLGGGPDSRLAKFFKRLETLANDPALTEQKRFLLEELQLYGQSIMPLSDGSDGEDAADADTFAAEA